MPKLFTNQPYLLTLYTTMFTTAYFGLFRISEMAHTPSGHAVQAIDVHIGRNKNKLMFVLHTSKTHGRGVKPQIVKVTSESQTGKNKPIYCLFLALKVYIKARCSIAYDDEQFYIFRDRSKVTAYAFRIVMQKVIKSLGLQRKFYSSHCFRSGRMVDLMEMGIPFETIKKLDRWRSNAIYSYMKY